MLSFRRVTIACWSLPSLCNTNARPRKVSRLKGQLVVWSHILFMRFLGPYPFKSPQSSVVLM
ncbi:hypothetical protein HanRHA438_Chr15g0720691 [Helianthus annuus]|nr:hypothetical protein HanRHA438_Chr15g0720691 [Helianthus annuus]